MSTTLKAVQNNTAPTYIITCERDDGTIIDLTSVSTVNLKLFRGSTQTNTGHESCTIETPLTAGNIGWEPKTGDLPNPGSYKGDVYVNYNDGTTEVLYNNLLLKVRKLLGS